MAKYLACGAGASECSPLHTFLRTSKLPWLHAESMFFMNLIFTSPKQLQRCCTSWEDSACWVCVCVCCLCNHWNSAFAVMLSLFKGFGRTVSAIVMCLFVKCGSLYNCTVHGYTSIAHACPPCYATPPMPFVCSFVCDDSSPTGTNDKERGRGSFGICFWLCILQFWHSAKGITFCPSL